MDPLTREVKRAGGPGTLPSFPTPKATTNFTLYLSYKDFILT